MFFYKFDRFKYPEEGTRIVSESLGNNAFVQSEFSTPRGGFRIVDDMVVKRINDHSNLMVEKRIDVNCSLFFKTFILLIP